MNGDTPWSPREPAPLRAAGDALAALRERRRLLEADHEIDRSQRSRVQQRLEVYPKTAVALEQLSGQLFERLISMLEEKLSIALQEVLGQPLKFKATLHGSIGFDVGMAPPGATILDCEA